MDLKEFQEYKFTENTEALVNGKWYNVINWSKSKCNGNYISAIEIYQCVNYSEIELREKPSELFVEIKKNRQVSFKDKLLDWIANDIKYRFKAVEYSGKNFANEKGWVMHQYTGLQETKIYFDDEERYSSEYPGITEKKYLLELLYEVTEEVKPELKEIRLLEKPYEQDSYDNEDIGFVINEIIKAVNELIRRLK